MSTNMSGMSISMDTTETDDHDPSSILFSPPIGNNNDNNNNRKHNDPQYENKNNHEVVDFDNDYDNLNIYNNNDNEMMNSSWDIDDARIALREATYELSERGLKLASKWAAEQLIGLAPTYSSKLSTKTTISTSTTSIQRTDLELYAKTILDMGEYYRAASILSVNLSTDNDTNESNNSSSSSNNYWTKSGKKAQASDLGIPPPKNNLSPYGVFLRAYALYMAGERRKEEEVLELRDPLERTTVMNSYIPQLLDELQVAYAEKTLDAFGLYIYGVVLKESQKSPSCHPRSSPRTVRHYGIDRNPPSAQSILIESLIQYRYNWSAWLDLAEICIIEPSINIEVEKALKSISNHWMYYFFCVHSFLENQANEDAIMVMEKLVQGRSEGFNGNNGFFISSPYLQTQLAVAYNNLRDFDLAQAHFTRSSECDPHRLDHMDVYSNILYVKEDKVGLSNLAHRAVKLDKYRPETCCIVGNYYSLKGHHEKAVQYFQRALKLDRSYLSAWTLMGHEYLEMRNSAAAIEAYRRAVDINAKDYRAWYGLGQTYEIMNMLLYALFYFNKAVEILPNDPRMWCALGKCYLGLERRENAIRSYERAVSNNDFEGVATFELATLYNEDGDFEKAARCYLRHLELVYQAQLSQSGLSPDGATVQTIIASVNVDEKEAEALLNLAAYHRDHGQFEMASMCCSRLLDYHGHPEREQAKLLLREIRSMIDNKQGNRNKISATTESFEFSP